MRSLPMVAALCLVVGCGADQTSIIVEVDAPDLAAGELDALRFQADGAAGPMADRTTDIPGSWPQTMAILPGRASSTEDVTIRVTGLSGGLPRIRRVTRARFEPGRTITIRVTLTPSCLDVACSDPFADCARGMCVGSTDGGMPDATVPDSTVPDSAMDSSVDSGMADADAMVDGMVDAMSDAMDSSVDTGPMDTGTPCTPTGPEVCFGDDEDCDGMIDEMLVCPVTPMPGHLLISEMSTGSATSGFDEFVEIHNTTDAPLSLANFEVQYLPASSATFAGRLTYPADAVIAPHAYYLAGGSSYTRGVTPDTTNTWASGLSRTGGHIRLVTAGGMELDRFSWGSAMMAETTPFPTTGSTENAGSYERKAVAASTEVSMSTGGADVDSGNDHDTGDASMDFLRRTMADPQNAASAAESP